MAKIVNKRDEQMIMRNAINTLVANLRFAGNGEPARTIMLTSSVPNEGKSTISVNLAAALARDGANVLIVEGDCHNRSVANMVGARGKTGLYSVLLGRVNVEDAIVSTQFKRLSFLDCEPNIPNAANVYASAQYKDLLRKLRGMYNYVIIDTPPNSAYIDASVIGAEVDAVLLVVRRNHVRRDDVRRAVEQLSKAGANVVGTVMNCCESERDYYYYGYYDKKRKKDTGDEPKLADAAVKAAAPAPVPVPAKAAVSQQAGVSAQAGVQAPRAVASAPAGAGASTGARGGAGGGAVSSPMPYSARVQQRS